MKKISILFFVVFAPFCCFSQIKGDFDEFCRVLAILESSNNPGAFNKSEGAIGIYQIRKLYFIDAQQFDKTLIKYKHEDCYDPEIAKRVVKSYFARYSKSDSWEEWAKLHNGGLNWKNKTGQAAKNLQIYWSKFKRIYGCQTVPHKRV